jgi:acyl-CoA synthetase (AMP-forming)/AMP-acid ligase II
MAMTNSYWPRSRDERILKMSTGDVLRRAAHTSAECTALVEIVPPDMLSVAGARSTARRWTYKTLLRDAESCASWLLSYFKSGEHICLWAPNVPESVIIQYGAALAGLVLVTANPALRGEELRHILRLSRSVALIHVAEFRGTNMSSVAAEMRGEVRELILIQDLESIFTKFSDVTSLPDVSSDSAAQMQFTSGTSGQPKGALLRHESLVTNSFFVAQRIGQDRDVVLTPMPLFHTAGSVLGVLGAAVTFSTLILPVIFDPGLMLEALVRERATITCGVPTMISALLEKLHSVEYDLSNIRVIYSGGGPVPFELSRKVRRAFGCPLVAVYGQTELSPIICATSPNDSEIDQAETSGLPLPQVEVRIADPATGEVKSTNQEGEIQARGYQTMIGYFGQPEDTKRTLRSDGWLCTGDLGRMDERGYVRVTGRLSDMVIRGGENIYPVEVENVLISHSSIDQAAVFGIKDDYWGEIVGAAIKIGQCPEPPTIDELRKFCRTTLATHKIPARWFLIDEFPLTASGKIQKNTLKSMVWTGTMTESF